jgi:hypothetical protein
LYRLLRTGRLQPEKQQQHGFLGGNMTSRSFSRLLRLTTLVTAGWLAVVLGAADGRAGGTCAGLPSDPTSPEVNETMAALCDAVTPPSSGAGAAGQTPEDISGAVDKTLAVAPGALVPSPPPPEPAQGAAAQPPAPTDAAASSQATPPQPAGSPHVTLAPPSDPLRARQAGPTGVATATGRSPAAIRTPQRAIATHTVRSATRPPKAKVRPARSAAHETQSVQPVQPRRAVPSDLGWRQTPTTSAVLASAPVRRVPDGEEDLVRLAALLLTVCSAGLAVVSALCNERERRRLRAERDRLF